MASLESVTDPKGIVGKTYYDNLGRTTKTIDDYVDGTPSDSDDQTTEYTYDGMSNVVTITADLPAGQNDQVTQYDYGFTSGALITNDALREVQYPNKTLGTASTSSSEQVVYTIDALGEVLTKTDQNGTVHTYGYDVLGRQTSDSVALAGGNPQGVDTSILRIDITYNTQGLVDKTTSYSSATGGTGAIVNQIMDVYNGLGQLTKQYQEQNGAVATGSTVSVAYGYDYSQADRWIARRFSVFERQTFWTHA